MTLSASTGSRMTVISDEVATSAYPPLGDLIDVDGMKVHATDSGTSGPPVVLLHGANVNLRDWTFSHVDLLKKTNRVIAMDRPGFGHSERGSGNWTPARQAAQLRGAVREMGAQRPILVGHSWGAVVALAWALETPEEVGGVVTVSGATMPWGRAVDVLEGFGITRVTANYYMSRLSRRADRGAVEAFVARAFMPQTAPNGYLDYVGVPLSLRASTIRANSEDLGQTHAALTAMSKRYSTLSVPVEIVHGERDWLLTVPRHVDGFAERLPNVRVSVAEGVGHMCHHARPDLLQAALANLSELVG